MKHKRKHLPPAPLKKTVLKSTKPALLSPLQTPKHHFSPSGESQPRKNGCTRCSQLHASSQQSWDRSRNSGAQPQHPLIPALPKHPDLIRAAPFKRLFEACPSHTRRAAICPFRSLALLMYILTLMTNLNYRKYFLQEVISSSLMTDNYLRKPGLKTKAWGDSSLG